MKSFFLSLSAFFWYFRKGFDFNETPSYATEKTPDGFGVIPGEPQIGRKLKMSVKNFENKAFLNVEALQDEWKNYFSLSVL